MKIIAQCAKCNHKEELSAEPVESLKCGCGGNMSTYKASILSPEELEKYKDIKPAAGKKPIGVVDRIGITAGNSILKATETERKLKEEKDLAKFSLTKDEYLLKRQSGMDRAEVATEQNVTYKALEYWLNKWEIKDPQLEELALLELAPTPVTVEQVNVFTKLQKELEAEQAHRAHDNETAARILGAEIEEHKAVVANLWAIIAEKESTITGLRIRNVDLQESVNHLEPLLQAAEGYAEGVPMEQASDNVNHPAHYTVGGIETIDFIKAKLTVEEFGGYCKGNVIKYVARARHKGGNEDLCKAAKYLEFATAAK